MAQYSWPLRGPKEFRDYRLWPWPILLEPSQAPPSCSMPRHLMVSRYSCLATKLLYKVGKKIKISIKLASTLWKLCVKAVMSSIVKLCVSLRCRRGGANIPDPYSSHIWLHASDCSYDLSCGTFSGQDWWSNSKEGNKARKKSVSVHFVSGL